MHHLTVLAAAFSLSGDDATPSVRLLISVPGGLRIPFSPACTGRVESRRDTADQLGLDQTVARGWEGAADLFERNEVARAQIWWHQHYLASFRSRGSSANNHVIAEAAGLLVGALAFDCSRRARDGPSRRHESLKTS